MSLVWENLKFNNFTEKVSLIECYKSVNQMVKPFIILLTYGVTAIALPVYMANSTIFGHLHRKTGFLSARFAYDFK